MMISLAQALKEKNRLAGEISYLWQLFQNENSCIEHHNRKIDVVETLQTIEHYTAKLVELKTKIGNANHNEHLRNMYMLEEVKNKIAKLNATSGNEDPIEKHDGTITKRTAIFNDEALIEMRKKLQKEANKLQDKLDEYNATAKIDYESPL